MKTHSLFRPALLFVASTVCSMTTLAGDVYFVEPIRDLQFTDGSLPPDFGSQPRNFRYRARLGAMQPYAALDGKGEIHVSVFARQGRDNQDDIPRVAVLAAEGVDVAGMLFLPKSDGTGMEKLRFKIPADRGNTDGNEFLRVKRTHFESLLHRDIAGAAWFRRQARDAAEALGQSVTETDTNRRRRFLGTSRASNMEDTFALVTGGRAVSENLQLDRVLPRSKPTEATVRVDSIQGITVRQFDWTSLVKDISPKADALASLVPDDQHALFFPSFQALIDMIDHADQRGTPVLRAADPQSEDAQTRERYQRQLCLPLGQLQRLFGPQLIASVAITGGDPYFRTGTDVVVLFEAKNLAALRTAIDSSVALAAKDSPHAKPIGGEIFGVEYSGFRSSDRDVCCYVATLENAVVVANSPQQLERLIRVQKGDITSLASLDEYRFFRHRYRLGDAKETALLIISDSTIRRWCGPRWRISTSRRTRAAAVMSDLQAKHLDRLVRDESIDEPIDGGYWLPEVDKFNFGRAGMTSSVYGTLQFQTPITELTFEYVTSQEQQFYQRWREGYQRNWSNFFDPIAVRFSAAKDELAADLSVMPLISNSRYDRFLEISKGAAIRPDDGDPHDKTLLHAALAINADSALLKQYAGFAGLFAPQIKVNPLSWVGNAVSVYADQDDIWNEMAKRRDPREFQRFMREQVHQLPIALHVEVRSGLRLTAFLTGVRAFVEQSAPGMSVWETPEYNERAYVKISPSEQARSAQGELEKLSLYYAASGDALIVTLSEDVLKRALDRQLALQKATNVANDVRDVKDVPVTGQRWIGQSMCLQVDQDFVRVMDAMFSENYRHVMQARSWGNIPILNQWRQRYPDGDPVRLHQQLWHRRLVCPGGGTYRWNASWQTMESTVYGHPGEPKPGPSLPATLQDIAQGNFGVTFEENGLRARVELRRHTND